MFNLTLSLYIMFINCYIWIILLACMVLSILYIATSDLFNDQGTTEEYLSMHEAGCVLNFRSCMESYCICMEKSYFCQWSDSIDCLPGFQLARGSRCKDCYMATW